MCDGVYVCDGVCMMGGGVSDGVCVMMHNYVCADVCV